MGAEELEQMADQIDKIGNSKPRVAERAAEDLLKLAKTQWSAGKAPSGRSWKPRKADGAIALAAITSGATSRAEGTTAVVELDDLALPHMTGRGRAPRRQTIPYEDAALPAKYEDALIKVATETLEQVATEGVR